jgi:hypothetical protein
MKLRHLTVLFAFAVWASPAEANAPDLSGTWYLRIRTATDAKVPIIGNTHIRSTTHLLATIARRDDGGFNQTQQTCAVDNRPSRSITRTVLPKAFIDHLPVKTYPIELTPGPDGSLKYDADLVQQYVGYDGVKANGTMPTKAKDPAVFDWDEDGKPGASILIDIPIFGHVRIYMVQTNHTFLKGTVEDEDTIKGTTHQRILAQRTIGADNRLLATSPKLSIGKGHNHFELMRTESGSTCADIMKLAEGTF